MACYRVLVLVDNGMGRQHGYLQADAPLADEAPKTAQGIPAKLTLNLLAPHSAIFKAKEVDQVCVCLRS